MRISLRFSGDITEITASEGLAVVVVGLKVVVLILTTLLVVVANSVSGRADEIKANVDVLAFFAGGVLASGWWSSFKKSIVSLTFLQGVSERPNLSVKQPVE